MVEEKKQEQTKETTIKTTEAQVEVNEKDKKTEKKEEKKVEQKIKKDYAKVMGWNLSMSFKEAGDICSMIRNRNIDKAITMVEEVIAMKRPVMMNKREASHQHGKGIMAGGYPINACKDFLRLLKGLKANAMHHELELEKVIIFCKADKAASPYRRGGRRFKRANVLIMLQKSKVGKVGVKK
jgi:ribosomal protein L22